MAREILFKAKRKDNGEWVEGSIITRKDTQRVFMVDIDNTTALRSVTTNYCDRYDWRAVEVQKDTICQYTGLTDKNGNKIWENDVVSDDGEKVGYVVFYKGSFVMWVQETNECEDLLINLCTERWTFYRGEYKRAEVIGNIFDNPELIKAGGVNE